MKKSILISIIALFIIIIFVILIFVNFGSTGEAWRFFKSRYQKNNAKSCLLDPDPGPCKASITKYYFHGKCKDFSWGGCRGVVPFDTLEKCRESCEPDIYIYLEEGDYTYIGENMLALINSLPLLCSQENTPDCLPDDNLSLISYTVIGAIQDFFSESNCIAGLEIFTSSAELIAETGCSTGCTGNARLYATIMRAMGIPTKIVETFSMAWINKNVGGNCAYYPVSGHFFAEIYDYDSARWITVNPSNRNYFDLPNDGKYITASFGGGESGSNLIVGSGRDMGDYSFDIHDYLADELGVNICTLCPDGDQDAPLPERCNTN